MPPWRNSHIVFAAEQRVLLEGVILKPSMVISGLDCSQPAGVAEVAKKTLECLLETVPNNVAGIAFLSGGQDSEQATATLNAMNARHADLPWPLTFSNGRGLQQRALEAWLGNKENTAAAQKQVFLRANATAPRRRAATGKRWKTKRHDSKE